MYKVIVNGADINNKKMRRTITVELIHETDIVNKAFECGFFYVSSYRDIETGVTTKIL